jgi:predicted metal-dependent HD superfamily phosphohydrolase
MSNEEIQAILNKWSIKMTIEDIIKCWSESHRHFHTTKHLYDLIDKINQRKNSISVNDYEKLIIVALFHDIVYDPKSPTNEEDSARVFINSLTKEDAGTKEIYQAILDTKTHEANTFISKIFCSLDMSVIEGNFNDLLEWEKGIWGEYQIFGKEAYKMGRLKFLNTLPAEYPQNADNLNKLIKWVEENY